MFVAECMTVSLGSNAVRVRTLKRRERRAPLLACADFAFPLLPHDKVLDLIAMLEFDGVDIGLFEGRSHLWPSKVFVSPVRSGKQLGRKLADRGLSEPHLHAQKSYFQSPGLPEPP